MDDLNDPATKRHPLWGWPAFIGLLLAVLLAIVRCPVDVRRIGFRPQPVQFRQIDAAIDQHFHTAGATGLPGRSRCVEPDIHALRQEFGQQHVVVTQNDCMGRQRGPVDELYSLLNQRAAPVWSAGCVLPTIMS